MIVRQFQVLVKNRKWKESILLLSSGLKIYIILSLVINI
jgi:hypothetical protein